MDPQQFDNLTRSLARTSSRRTVFKWLAGGIAGSLAGVVSHRHSDAFICRDVGVLCAKDAQCCSGNCVAYHCACPVGQTLCDDTCENLQSDVNNCGNCGTICVAPAHAIPTCSGGSCGFACNSGFKPCNGSCIPNGMCCANSDCSGGKTCQAGTCACPTGMEECSGTCVDTSTDQNNCGQCGNSCGGSGTCTGGNCQCPAGQTFCECGIGCATIGTSANCDCFGPCESGFVCTGTQCCTPDHSVCQIRQC